MAVVAMDLSKYSTAAELETEGPKQISSLENFTAFSNTDSVNPPKLK
jgi:hypothetical protein